MKKLHIILLIAFLCACESDTPPEPTPNIPFDRTAMLKNWADNIIIPGYTEFSQKTQFLQEATEDFLQTPNESLLENLRMAWSQTYMFWQRVAMFNMGKAAELRYRDQLNIYPTNPVEIEENISSGVYNLELPSQNDRQGFPALDYLLHGIGETDTEILTYYTTHAQADNYKKYLSDLSTRIHSLTLAVLDDWTSGGFRDSFVNNDGSSATASVDLLVNDFMFYYEKNLRAGKVGIPAGVFSGTPLSTHVEGFYKKDMSKSLLQEALLATQAFFNGKAFSTSTQRESLKSYLDYLDTMKDGSDLSTLINNQFDRARGEIDKLDDNFVQQIETDNIALLAAFDQLQLNVVLLKVDMLQALNINVDYVDADGD